MDPNTIQERYNDTPQPMLKSEMDVLLDRGIRLRQYINTLVEKRGALRPTALIKSDDIDDVEFAQMQEDEEERIAKLLKRYTCRRTHQT